MSPRADGLATEIEARGRLYLPNNDVITYPNMSGSMRSSKSRTGLPSHTFEKGNGDDQVILFHILSLSPPLIPIPIPYFFYIACSPPLFRPSLRVEKSYSLRFIRKNFAFDFVLFRLFIKLKSPLVFISEGFIFLLVFYLYCYHSCFGSYFSFCF